jgi:hypothetical protein
VTTLELTVQLAETEEIASTQEATSLEVMVNVLGNETSIVTGLRYKPFEKA